MSTILLCIFLMSCSFIFSASEIAVFSLSRLQLKKIKDRSEVLFRKIRTLTQNSMGFLVTVLLFNEVVNIAVASIITSHWIEPLDLNWRLEILVGILATTPLILIYCELTPKIVASRSNLLVISAFLPIVYAIYQLTRPVVALIRVFIPEPQVRGDLHHLREDDFLILAEERAETGHLHETELELIKNVFEMDDTRVDQLATPMRRIVTIPSNFTLEQASQVLFKEKVFSRIPISGKYKEDIVGVINTKDLVEIKLNPEMKTENVMTLAHDPFIVSGNLTTEVLFRKMKSKKVQVAFIKNAHDRVTGMITLQDILDTLIEEAFEE